MQQRHNIQRRRTILTAACVAQVACAGCGIVSIDGGGSPVDGNRNSTANDAAVRTSGEPNDDFTQPIVALFDASRRAKLEGSIAAATDIDVFDLGPLNAGDRIVVDVDTNALAGSLDSMIGLFDADQNLFANNDDSGFTLDSTIDEIVRHDSERYYLVVSASTFADRFGLTGSYRVDVEVASGQLVPSPHGQTVFLDFDGGLVDADNLGIAQVPTFDAADIHPRYTGQTELIKEGIVDRFTAAFDGFDVTVFTSDDAVAPRAPFTTVFFGGFPPVGLNAFGISEHVDQFNEDPGDIAVIFTETFSPHVFTIPPTAEQLGLAIGNIAAHEAGHLLGLDHVADSTALMDAVSPADTFLEVQVFKHAPLYAPELFPIGFQDAVLLLSEIVGVL